MNIAMFIPWITQNRGGTEHVGSMIANACAEQGHRVFIHTFDSTERPQTFPLHEGIEVSTHAENPTPTVEMQILTELSIQRPDILVGLHLGRDFYQYTYYASKLRVPLLLSEHYNPKYSHKKGIFTRDERNLIFQRADRIHLLAGKYANTLAAPLKDRVRIIPNTAHRPELPCKKPGEVDQKTLLYVGRLARGKRVAQLLEAFHALGDEAAEWRLLLVGTGPEEQPLHELAEKLGIKDKIIFTGQVEDTYALYRAASIFISPSAFEAQSLAVIEAMAHGLPVIVYNDCEGMDMIQDRVTGLLAERGTGLVTALAKLMRDVSFRGELGRAGRELYEKEYAPEIFKEKWIRLLEETASIPEPIACQSTINPTVAEAVMEQAFAKGAAADVAKIMQAHGGPRKKKPHPMRDIHFNATGLDPALLG